MALREPSSLPAEVAGRPSGLPFERGAQVFGVLEARPGGDLFQREARLAEQLLHPLETAAPQLLVRRAAERGGEPTVKGGPRQVGLAEQVLDPQTLAGAGPDRL